MNFDFRKKRTKLPELGSHSVLKGRGVRKMFFSETTKGLFWSIGSSYWMFNLEVHIWVTGNKIMAKKWLFLAKSGPNGLGGLFFGHNLVPRHWNVDLKVEHSITWPNWPKQTFGFLGKKKIFLTPPPFNTLCIDILFRPQNEKFSENVSWWNEC